MRVEGLLAADEDSSAADGRLCSLYVSSLRLVVCSKSRVRARVTSGLLRSTSQQPEPMSLAKPFRVRASQSHTSERNHCLGLSSDNNHCHSRIQAIRYAIDSITSHSSAARRRSGLPRHLGRGLSLRDTTTETRMDILQPCAGNQYRDWTMWTIASTLAVRRCETLALSCIDNPAHLFSETGRIFSGISQLDCG